MDTPTFGRFSPSVEQAIFLVGAAVASYLSGPGITENSNSVVTLITPANWAFAIWVPIFLILGVVAIFPQWIKFEGMSGEGIRTSEWVESPDTRYWLMVCFALLGSWGYIFNLRPVLGSYFPSVSNIGLALYTAIAAKGTNSYGRSAGPLSPLIGWLTCATAVNIAVWLKADFGLADSDFLAGVVLFAVGILACVACYLNHDWLYLLVILFTLVAIYARTGSAVPLVAAAFTVVGSVVAWNLYQPPTLSFK